MEPYRILVDRIVYGSNWEQFDANDKRKMLSLLEQEITISGNKQVLTNAIRIYVRSVFDALCDRNVEEILYYSI